MKSGMRAFSLAARRTQPRLVPTGDPRDRGGPAQPLLLVEKLRKLGTTLVKLPVADEKRLAGITATNGTSWAGVLDKRGKPGTEVLKAFRAALPPAK